MKKILITFFLLINLVINAQVPCPNDNNFWLDLTPTGPGNTQTSSCTYAGDYDTFTAIVGVDYIISVCGGSYNSAVTMYDNLGNLLYSQNATPGNGCETFTWTSTVSGIVRVLVDRDNCGTNSVCTTVNITQYNGGSGSPSNQNCSSYTQICNDASFNGNSNGYGTQELNASNKGCLSTEHQSSWYVFQVSSSGTLALSITTSVDYDFAIWGPNVTCGSLGTPIRCSWAAGGGNTGLGNGATDNSEWAGGDRWVSALPVIAGETYIMLIDNYTANSTPFTLDWTMSGGASLNCTPLPIGLISFNGTSKGDYNEINWSTSSEVNNDYFIIKKSVDGINWNKMTEVKGAGNSSNIINYKYLDYYFKNDEYNYYRLSQIDFSGEEKIFNIIVIDNNNNNNNKTPNILMIYNQYGQKVSEEYKGFVIYYYDDGSTKKVIKE